MRFRPAALALILACTPAIAAPPGPAPSRAERATHERLIVLDTHFDTPMLFGRPGWSMIERHSTAIDGDQVDYPRMADGGVDGGWFAIFIAQGPRTPEGDARARDAALVRAVEIREMIARHADRFELALVPGDAERIARAGKRFVFMSMENGAAVEGDVSLLRSFRALGLTMASPVHFRNNDLADSATDRPEWNGLSPKGRAYVAEANRLGILLDASHSSDAALRQMIELSSAPIILSHSGVRAVFDHPRNASDADLRLLAAKGGVVQINAYSPYMITTAPHAERDAALAALRQKRMAIALPTIAQNRALVAEERAIDARWPAARATFDDFMKHLLHAIAIVGIDHVGISGDFDGGGGIDGLDDVTDYPKITAALLRAGHNDADIAKVWGGNALRVLGEAQRLAEPGAVPRVSVTR